MNPIRFSVSNNVKYYKSVHEAFADANPQLKGFLCPELAAKEKNLTIIDTLTFIAKKLAQLSDIKIEGNNPQEVLESLKKAITPKKQKELAALGKLTEFLEQYKDRGPIGEVLLKQRLRREGGEILQELKATGAKI